MTKLITTNQITVKSDRGVFQIRSSSPHFDRAKTALLAGDVETFYKFADSKTAINNLSNGRVTVVGNQVFYDGKQLHNVVVDRILTFIKEGIDFQPLTNFLERLYNNTSNRVIEHLFSFLEYGGFPISEDGCIIAYKYVGDDYMDCHTHTFDNSPGKVVSMPRNEVDDDPKQGCSRGLHVGTHEYAGSGGSHLMMVKLDPADVVCIPYEYSFQKIRCCKYTVLEEITDRRKLNDPYLDTRPQTVNNDEGEDGEEWEDNALEESFYEEDDKVRYDGNVGAYRDSRGRFARKP